MKINGCKLDPKTVRRIDNLVKYALHETGEALRDDLKQSRTMPFQKTDTKKHIEGGTLQNDSTFVDDSKIGKGQVSIISDTPYARRLYFHPEYNFYQGENPNAGGEWFEPYLTGEKKDYAQKVFAASMRKGL